MRGANEMLAVVKHAQVNLGYEHVLILQQYPNNETADLRESVLGVVKQLLVAAK